MNQFTLNLICNNCKNEWTETVPLGTNVDRDGAGALMYEMGGTKHLIMCPKCNTFHKIQRR